MFYNFELSQDFILIIIANLVALVGVLLIMIGSIVALYEFFLIVVKNGWRGRAFNEIRLDYAHYIILGLDFFIAKDLIDVMINTTFDMLIQLLLVIIVRTFLSYFLHQDIINIQKTKHFHRKNKK